MSATQSPQWMIYGANGYTGELIAREAASRGLKPILAGRNPRVATLAQELGGLESRVFSLSASAVETAAHLKGISAVLHCAGPFSATSRPMLDACIQAHAHYLDITGEIDVFESVFARSEELKRAGIAALPGSGFDVVPTDCLAALLASRLPDANQLKLAYRADGKISPGTLKSMVEGLAQGGRVREKGKLVVVPLAARSLGIDFKGNGRPVNAILSPWGDVATAFYSTGIPNIEFYIATPKKAEIPMRAMGQLLKRPALLSLAQRLIGSAIKGPNEHEREKGRCWLWGEVRNPRGEVVRMRLETSEGYRFTIHSALACVQKISRGGLSPGAWTPSKAFGLEFALSIEGVGKPVELRD